jgi:hypothetical protein
LAAWRKSSPIGTDGEPVDLNDGTLARNLSPLPGPCGHQPTDGIVHERIALRRHRQSRKGLPFLQQGMGGPYVRWLQILLNDHGGANPSLRVDGVFGPETFAAVRGFQRDSLISADGAVGPQTWVKLVAPGASSQSSGGKSGFAAPSNQSTAQGVTSVADWPLTQRFEKVLRLAPQHMAPELANQFRAMLTPANIAIAGGTLAVWAVSQAFGVGEVVDAILLVVGAAFVGLGIFKAGEDLGECLMSTLQAQGLSDLDRAADFLAQAVVILGVTAFFALLAKMAGRLSRGTGAAGEDASGSASPAGAGDAAPKPPPSPKAPKPRVVEEPVSPPENFSDPIVKRRAINEALRNSPQFQKDLVKAGVSKEQLGWMDRKEAPLGFENPKQYQSFKQDLAEALRKDGLEDAKVGMKGTATTFYSENPSKAAGHFWDADPTHPGDFDLNLSSAKMADQMNKAGIGVSPKYGIFRTADVNSQFPAISDFSAKWSSALGRDVNVVGYPAGTTPVRDATEFMVK